MDGAGAIGGCAAQPVGIAPAFLVLRGLSYKDRPGPIWTSPAGVRVTCGDGPHGAPYGIDRGVFFGLATEARRQGRAVRMTWYRLAAMIGVSWPRCTVLKRLRRVAASTIEAPRHGPGCVCGCALMAPRATVAESLTHHRGNDTFGITLTDAFMVEVEHGAPVSLAAVSQLLSKTAALELYTALVLRAHRGDRSPLPLFERGGLCDLVDLADADFKARQDIGKRLRLIGGLWPELPYRLQGDVLVCNADPRSALAAHIDRAAGQRPQPGPGPVSAPTPRAPNSTPTPMWTVTTAPASAPSAAPTLAPQTLASGSATPSASSAPPAPNAAPAPRITPTAAPPTEPARQQVEQYSGMRALIELLTVRPPPEPPPAPPAPSLDALLKNMTSNPAALRQLLDPASNPTLSPGLAAMGQGIVESFAALGSLAGSLLSDVQIPTTPPAASAPKSDAEPSRPADRPDQDP